MSLQRPNLSHPVAGAELAAGRVLWLPDFPQAGNWGNAVRLDATGRGHNATLVNGPVWNPGPGYGMALDYDGSNDYSEVPSSSDLSAQNCTFAVSFQTSQSVALVFPWLFGRAGPVFSENGVYIHLDMTTGFARGSVKSGLDYVADATGGSAALNDGQWHRVHLVVQDQFGIFLYVDGVLVASDGFSGTWSFGAYVTRTAVSLDAFWAKLDGLAANEAIWDRPLTAAEVRLDWERERQARAPVRRLPRQEAFNTGGGTAVWTPTPDVLWELSAWVASASGSQGVTWTPPNVAWELTDWVTEYIPTYSLSVVWQPPNVQWALTSWGTSVSQPPSSIKNPLVARVPRSNPAEALTRFTERVKSYFNAFARRGQLVQFGPTDYKLFGAAYLIERAPTASDDSSRGYFEGVVWINTGVTPRTAYMLTDATAGAATWLQLG